MCAARTGRWRRIYIGKNLDTGRFIDPNDNINWALIDRRPSESKAIQSNEVTQGSVEYPPVKTTAESRRRARFFKKIAALEALPDERLHVEPPPAGIDRQAKGY
jgi:hypothetical protein